MLLLTAICSLSSTISAQAPLIAFEAIAGTTLRSKRALGAASPERIQKGKLRQRFANRNLVGKSALWIWVVPLSPNGRIACLGIGSGLRNGIS